MHITLGNAAMDGASFNSWFMGDLGCWASAQLPDSAAIFGLRQSRVVEFKWIYHRTGETRMEWAPCSEKTTLSLLVRGKFLLRFRSLANGPEITERRLQKEGDYAIWAPDVEHTWIVEEDSLIFSARWIEK